MADATTELRLFNDYDELRRCIDCKQLRPLDAFHRKTNRLDGLQKFCKGCSHQRVMAWHANNSGRYQYTCTICGEHFTSSRKKRKNAATICSNECHVRQAGEAAQLAGRANRVNAESRRLARPDRSCANHFSCTATIAGASLKRYCTDECKADAAKHRARAARSPLRAAIDDWDYQSMVTALLDKASIEGELECWVWPNTCKDGYSRVPWSKNFYRRIVEVTHGKPLGSQAAHHACANRACVRPDHLQPVTHAENMAEMLGRKAYKDFIAECLEAIAALDAGHPLLNRIPLA